jgi:hypothetical protein
MNELIMYYVCELLNFLFYIGEFSSLYFNNYSFKTHILNS